MGILKYQKNVELHKHNKTLCMMNFHVIHFYIHKLNIIIFGYPVRNTSIKQLVYIILILHFFYNLNDLISENNLVKIKQHISYVTHHLEKLFVLDLSLKGNTGQLLIRTQLLQKQTQFEDFDILKILAHVLAKQFLQTVKHVHNFI